MLPRHSNLKGGMNNVIFPVMDNLIQAMCTMAKSNAHIPMPSCIHPWSASPTTWGKKRQLLQ